MTNKKEDITIGEPVELPKITDKRGNLTFIEENEHIPFNLKRVYYLYDVPKDQMRGAHAHKELKQFFIAVCGNFDLILDDSNQTERIQLSSPDCGIYVPPGIWRDLENFSSDSVCLVLASEFYDEEDYIREYEVFVEWRNNELDRNP